MELSFLKGEFGSKNLYERTLFTFRNILKTVLRNIFVVLFQTLKLPQGHKIHLLLFNAGNNVSKTLSYRAPKNNRINVISTYKVVSLTRKSINLCQILSDLVKINLEN